MKKLTLNQSWKRCLRMWKWVIEHLEEFNGEVFDAKVAWIKQYFFNEGLKENCFFCEYNEQQEGSGEGKCVFCSQCPGKLVNRRFDCGNVSYHWYYNPIKFYEKLLQLNAKRLESTIPKGGCSGKS